MDERTTKNYHNLNLEGLRGICALTVALSHVLANQILSLEFNSWITYAHFSHAAVLVFFILSGYVIGLSNNNSDFSKKTYLSKRWIRIYPIYFTVVIFCFTIEPQLDLVKIFGSLLLLIGITPALQTNGPLWSIHYEALFYLLFLIVPKGKKSILIQGAIYLVFALIIYISPKIPQIIGGYFTGFIFWLTGLLLSKLPQELSSKKGKIISMLLLLLATNHIVPGAVILNQLGLENEMKGMVSFADIFFLPSCILIIIEVCQIKLRPILRIFLLLISYLFPLLIMFYLILTGRIFESERWLISSFAILLSFLFLLLPQKIVLLRKFAFWGSISYALYIVHYPIGKLLEAIYIPTKLLDKIILIVIWFLSTVTISWLLEIKFQKKFRRLFNV